MAFRRYVGAPAASVQTAHRYAYGEDGHLNSVFKKSTDDETISVARLHPARAAALPALAGTSFAMRS
jgi:hypothetical protein